MTHRSYRAESRKDWGTREAGLTLEQVRAGAILRIADATEAMAKSYTNLIAERDCWEQTARSRLTRIERLTRANAALRGHLKRAKTISQKDL